MNTLLITISLVLHGFTFMWIFTLMQRVQQPNETSKQEIKELKQELEDMLLAYTSEIKEENERLLSEIQTKAKKESKQQPVIQKVQQPSPKPYQQQQYKKEIVEDKRYDEYIPPIDVIQEEQYEPSDKTKVLELSKQGLTTDQIAKRLEMGKGEVELLLKFHQ